MGSEAFERASRRRVRRVSGDSDESVHGKALLRPYVAWGPQGASSRVLQFDGGMTDSVPVKPGGLADETLLCVWRRAPWMSFD